MSYHKLGDVFDLFGKVTAATGMTTTPASLSVADQPARAIMIEPTEALVSARLLASRYAPTTASVFAPEAPDVEDGNLGTGMKYSTNLDKGGTLIGAGGGGGLPSGGDGCPSGSSAVMGPDGKMHCCSGGKCCPGQHLILKVDPTAKEGVGCACAPGYSKFVANTQDPMLSDCVKGPGDPPAGGASGGMAMAAAGVAALALLLFRK